MIIVEKGKGKLYQQIYDCIKAEILSGVLQEGDMLMPIRELAKVLQVGKNTVTTAYQNLVADGYVVSKQGAGYYVEGNNIDDFEELVKEYKFDFSKSVTARENFPWNQWKKKINEALLEEEYGSGSPKRIEVSGKKLKQSVSRYIKYFRGINVEPEQLVICTGVLDAVEKVKNVIADFSNGITFMEPCHPAIRNIFRTASIPIYTMQTDSNESEIEDMYDVGYNFLFLYTEHYMMERKNSGEHIRMIHEWIERIGGYVIQYDKGISGITISEKTDLERMILIGSFDSVMPEEIRLSYIILPKILAKRYQKIYSRMEPVYPCSYQIALSQFLDEGHLFNMIRKNTFWNKSKRIEFQEIAENYFKDNDCFKIRAEYGYMAQGIVVQFSGVKNQREFLKEVGKRGVKIVGAKDFWHNQKDKGEDIFIFGYTAYEEAELEQAFSIIYQLINEKKMELFQ